MMSLASLFDDFPFLPIDNGAPSPRRCRIPTSGPLLYSILNTLEDQMDQKVGHVFRRLPAIILNLEDEFENNESDKKGRLRSEETFGYEPKSKAVVTNKDNKFQISLDTSNYQPGEITVKVINDKLAISAKHEAKGKDFYEFYEMYRSFDLPKNVDPNSFTSRLSANGELTVEAPLKVFSESNAINIPVAIEGKQQPAVESSEIPSTETNSS